MSNKYTLLTFKGICMNFLLELKFFILSHPVTSKQPHKIVQIHMGHPVSMYVVCLYTLMHIPFLFTYLSNSLSKMHICNST